MQRVVLGSLLIDLPYRINCSNNLKTSYKQFRSSGQNKNRIGELFEYRIPCLCNSEIMKLEPLNTTEKSDCWPINAFKDRFAQNRPQRMTELRDADWGQHGSDEALVHFQPSRPRFDSRRRLVCGQRDRAKKELHGSFSNVLILPP